MSHAPLPLPQRPDLNWLRNRARERLAALRASDPAAPLAQAQLAVARDFGFASWRALKAHVDAVRAAHDAAAPAPPAQPAVPLPLNDPTVQAFFHLVARGDGAAVTRALDAAPALANVAGPHPFWGGRPQALHVAIESKQGALVELLLARGADPTGDGATYAHWSPRLLAVHAERPDLVARLAQAGAPDSPAEALLRADDAALEAMLVAAERAGRDPLAGPWPSEGAVLALARTPFAVERLLGLGADARQADLWGSTPEDAFSRLGARGRPLLALLAAHGVAISPTAAARLGDRDALAQALRTDRAAVCAPETLRAAVEAGQQAVVEWLLAQGADVNGRARAPEFATALHAAAWVGDLAMAQCLVAAGADPAALDRRYGAPPAGWAETGLERTGNARCAEVAAYLRSLTAPAT